MRNKILTRASVLEAAEQIIRLEGLQACSMRRISGALGVAVGTIYNYYDTRDALLIELFTEQWAQTAERVQVAISDLATREDQLLAFIETVTDEVRNGQGLGRAIYDYKCQDPTLVVGRTSIREALQNVLASVLIQEDVEDESITILSQWIVTILVDALTTEREISRGEVTIFNQMIQMNMCCA